MERKRRSEFRPEQSLSAIKTSLIEAIGASDGMSDVSMDVNANIKVSHLVEPHFFIDVYINGQGCAPLEQDRGVYENP